MLQNIGEPNQLVYNFISSIHWLCNLSVLASN